MATRSRRTCPIWQVGWIGPAAAKRLHDEGKAIFLDCRERWEYDLERISGSHSVPMREFVDYGLQVSLAVT